MKVAVYTIALNEAANAERWARSAADADYRIVADTGSTDGTVERLEALGVTVHRITIRPWRFDLARNAAMALIPSDVDVCCTMDMDRWLAPDWRPALEAAWTADTTALFCRTIYRPSYEDPTVLKSWPTKNFHGRWGYRFRRPVHEELAYTGEREVSRGSEAVVMYEAQDYAKATRAQYFPLMEVAHREDPQDAQIAFWLGREYMWAGRSAEASRLFRTYLELPHSNWSEERAEAMRYLARVEPDLNLHWLQRAREEAPHRREIWLDLAELFHASGAWPDLFWACSRGLEGTHRTGSYLDDLACWGGSRLYELGALAALQMEARGRAVEWARTAASLTPSPEELDPQLQSVLGAQ